MFFQPLFSAGGSHGYNNSLMDMHPFFIAHGPAFRKNYTSKPFSNVDIYGLICHILDVSGIVNNNLHVLFSIIFCVWCCRVIENMWAGRFQCFRLRAHVRRQRSSIIIISITVRKFLALRTLQNTILVLLLLEAVISRIVLYLQCRNVVATGMERRSRDQCWRKKQGNELGL